MAPQAKRVKIGTLPDSGCLEANLCTPVSKVKRVRSKKTNNVLAQMPVSPPKASTNRSLNTTLEPGLAELFCHSKSNSKSANKRNSKKFNGHSSLDSPGIAELLDMSTKKPKTPNPKTVDEVFEKYMEQDPYASIWDFIPREKAVSPDKPLTFFSPTKERPRTVPRKRINRANDEAETLGNPNKTVDLGHTNPIANRDITLGEVTPIFGKRLGAGAYSPCNSTGTSFSRLNGCTWLNGSGLNETNGSSYSPMPGCSTPSSDPFKTPWANSCRPLSSTGVPLSGVKALFQERSSAADSSVNTPDGLGALRNLSPSYHIEIPDHVKATILLGVICFVDCKYNNEDRAKYVQKECIALGAKVEKNFTKKVTHVVFKSGKMSTYMKAKEQNIPIVSLLWLEACKVVGNMVDPALYPPTDNEKYQNEIPIEEARRRERFLKRGRAFLDRINGKLPAKPTRVRSGKNAVVSATEGKKRNKVARSVSPVAAVVRDEPSEISKVPKKLDFNRAGPRSNKKPDSGDSDYVSESDPEDVPGQSKRRKSAPPVIGGDISSDGGTQKKLTQFFNELPKVKKPEGTPRNDSNDLMTVLTGGFTTADKKKRKLFDPNQSHFLTQPLPSTPIELSPYVKDSPQSKRSGSRSRTTSSRKPPSRSQSTSSKAGRRVRDAKRPVTARKSLVPLMEQQEEEEDALTVSTSRNSLACFDLTRKGKVVAPKCQPRIAFTSLPKEDLATYKGIISRLGTFAVDSAVTKHTTHLVTSNTVKRTVNLLKAIARGCWILDVEWLVNSEQRGKWMSEEPFEHKSFSEAVTASRLGRQAFGKDYSMDLFSDCGPIFVDSSVQPPRVDLISLLKICCAKVVNASTKADIIISLCPLAEDYPKVHTVSPQWVLDSITYNKRMDLTKYKI